MDQRRRSDMHGIDRLERNCAASIRPVSRRGLRIIEGILRFALDYPHERQRGLVLAACRMTEIDAGGRSVLRDQATERILRDAAHEAGRSTEPRQPNGNVET